MNIEVVINVLKYLLNLKNISPKANWFIVKRFWNNNRISCIPLFFQENKFLFDYKEKAEIFNSFLQENVTSLKMIANNHMSFYL